MADNPQPSSEKEQALDLEQLRDLSFAPQWSSPKSSQPRTDGGEERSKRRPSGPARDRRPPRKRPERRDGETQSRAPRSGRGDRPNRPEPYRPIVQFSVYPEDEPFDLLTQSIRSSLKIYELFEVTRLILDKTDRMVVVVSPLSEEAAPLYESLPDRQVFFDEAAAIKHAANLLLPKIFEENEEEVDPPEVKFSSVLRCKASGKYLPPKSYHRYQELLLEHQRLHCPKLSVQQVERGLEAVAEPEAVQEWRQSMSRRSVFRLRSENSAEEKDRKDIPVETPKDDAATPPAESEPSDESESTPASAPAAEEPSEPQQPLPSPASEASTPAEEEESSSSPPPAPNGLVLDSREAALAHLIRTQKDSLVRETRQARVPARALAEGEDEQIRQSFHSFIEQQKRFPLDTANNVRMKLRKAKFFIFKKGKKGISYVSAVRKRNRPSGAVFADSAEAIISVLESNPGTKLKELAERLYPESIDESQKAKLQPEQARQLVQDLKWLKSEGYLYEYSDGTLELHPKEHSSAPASESARSDSPESNDPPPESPEASDPTHPSE